MSDQSPEHHIVTTPETDIEDVKWKSRTADPVQNTPNLQHSIFFFLYWTTGLACSLNYAKTTPALTQKKWSTDKIKHDIMEKKKENKDVALTLACIIFTVKTMILTCKEEYSFFVKNKIPTTNLLFRLCQCVYDQHFFSFFSVTCMSSHIFARRKFSKFLTIRSVLTCGGLSIFLCTFL